MGSGAVRRTAHRILRRCAGWRLPHVPPALPRPRCSPPGSSGRWSAYRAVPSGAPSPVARQLRMAFLRDHSAPSRLLAIRSRSHPFNSDSSQPTVRRLSRIGRGKSPRATTAGIDLRDRPVGPRPRASAGCAATPPGPLTYLVTSLSFRFYREGFPHRGDEGRADPAAGDGVSWSPGARPRPWERRGPRRHPGARPPTGSRSGSVHPHCARGARPLRPTAEPPASRSTCRYPAPRFVDEAE